MPYRRKGNLIQKRTGGKWRTVQRCASAAKAKAALRLRRGVEHGWKPTGKKKGRRRK